MDEEVAEQRGKIHGAVKGYMLSKAEVAQQIQNNVADSPFGF